MSAAIDTMIVSWVLRKPPEGGNPDSHAAEMRKRALLLWMELYDKQTQIIIPTVVVSECLVPIPRLEHGGFIAKLQKNASWLHLISQHALSRPNCGSSIEGCRKTNKSRGAC